MFLVWRPIPNIVWDVTGTALELPLWVLFATGWLIDGKFWGRPVDIEQAPDGSLFVSDDHAGVIYRISYDE